MTDDGRRSDSPLPRPASLPEMIRIAEQAAAEFPVVRVDFYVTGKKIYIGEMTFTSSSGFEAFTSLAYEIMLGRKIKLPEKKYGLPES